jgi:hypothetical protein
LVRRRSRRAFYSLDLGRGERSGSLSIAQPEPPTIVAHRASAEVDRNHGARRRKRHHPQVGVAKEIERAPAAARQAAGTGRIEQEQGRISGEIDAEALGVALIALLDGIHVQRLLDSTVDVFGALEQILALIEAPRGEVRRTTRAAGG